LPKVNEELLRVAAGAAPVPVRARVSGLSLALVAVEMAAVLAPKLVGVKTTLMTQLALTASGLTQVFVCVNMALFAPVTVMPLIVSAAVPVFVIVEVSVVEVFVWLNPKARLAGLKVTSGAVTAIPVPVMAKLSGLSEAFVTVWTVEARAPKAEGVKLTLMRQLLPAVRGETQFVLSPKSPVLPPVTVMEVIVSDPVPVFESVTVRVPDVVLIV
jgi:hypothetical protein